MGHVVRVFVVVGYVLMVVYLPKVVFDVRRTWLSMLFVASLWLVIAAAVQTNLERWSAPVVVTDAMRVTGVSLFFLYLVLRHRERSHDGADA